MSAKPGYTSNAQEGINACYQAAHADAATPYVTRNDDHYMVFFPRVPSQTRAPLGQFLADKELLGGDALDFQKLLPFESKTAIHPNTHQICDVVYISEQQIAALAQHGIEAQAREVVARVSLPVQVVVLSPYTAAAGASPSTSPDTGPITDPIQKGITINDLTDNPVLSERVLAGAWNSKSGTLKGQDKRHYDVLTAALDHCGENIRWGGTGNEIFVTFQDRGKLDEICLKVSPPRFRE